MNPEYAVFIFPGLVVIMLLALIMQYLKAKDMKSTGLSQYSGVISLLLMLVMIVLFLLFAMIIIGYAVRFQ